jgi:hypothetical protein
MDQHECILLDTENFHVGTRKWDVPILRLPGVKTEELYFDGVLVAPGEYSVSGNTLTLSKNHDVKKTSKAYLTVGFNPTNMLITFWLPIIVAIFGLLGSIGQPILYNLGVLYQPDLDAQVYTWNYDIEKHQFTAEMAVANLTKKAQQKWYAYIAVRPKRKDESALRAIYNYVAGPFTLQETMELAVVADSSLTDELRREHLSVEAFVFFAEKDLKIGKGFRPADYPTSSLKVFPSPSIQPF